jgi:hypothetical protein
MNDDRPLFQGLDEQEKIYAPQELPASHPERQRVEADEQGRNIPAYEQNERPAAAPVANAGNAPSAAMAPPNIGHEEHGGAPGDPNTQARDPLTDPTEETA